MKHLTLLNSLPIVLCIDDNGEVEPVLQSDICSVESAYVDEHFDWVNEEEDISSVLITDTDYLR